MDTIKIDKVKWKKILQDGQEDEISSDDEIENWALRSDLKQSAWISEILKNEPLDKVYIRKEDPRVGGYRAGPS